MMYIPYFRDDSYLFKIDFILSIKQQGKYWLYISANNEMNNKGYLELIEEQYKENGVLNYKFRISPSNDYNMTNKNIEQAYNKKASNKCEQIKTDLNISEIKSNKLPFKIKAYFIFRYCRNCFKVKETDETPYLCDCGYTTCSICKRDPHENLSCQNFW